ncbi:error-prone DNA polymerase [Thalassotalea agarivorans]|uniref:Error-prone DNA polymerase n=2 Tax=Thalassotalea agarivorans TaxID=349064 RepID=A0A1I0GT72_THASX|nr:error-prone DNA polymerase [Thalassotalea agarivorans]
MYAELICQTNFSFLQGASHPHELVQQAEALGYSAIAITDECSVAGVVRAYSHIQAEALDIKLIIGASFKYQAVNGATVAFTLLCPNRQAYAELCRVITNSRRRAGKGQYQLDLWDLKTIKQCLVLWSPSGDVDADDYWASWLKKHMRQRLYIALKRHLTAGEHSQVSYCRQLAKSMSIMAVATGGVLMHEKSRLPLHHTLTAIRLGKTVAQLGKEALSNAEASLRPISTLQKLFLETELEASLAIANQCQFCLSSLRYEYPAELIPEGKTAIGYLRELVKKGKQIRFPAGVPAEIESTIEKELILIEQLQYEHFFITIYDVVQFAKKQKILYQGRGSAANSVVCYCLEITAVDPRQISVLFERFISQERQEPPDIDVDFEHQRREEVFQYLYQKYGRERTAIAATVVTYRLKSAIREVGKALGINETQLAFFIKHINRRDKDSPWDQQVMELGIDPSTKLGQQFVSLVEQIKGFPRHLSQHVGGFVISSGPLYELVPVENAAMEGRTVIQWDKDDLETLALLKVDVLALGMLTAIRKTFDLVKQHYGFTLSIADITRMGDDKQVYAQIQQADTVGVFQIESRAQMSMLPRLKPACYYDLVIQIAIVRPGPIQGGMVHPFLKRRDGSEPVTYPSEAVKSVLARTLGVPIFQEQVIKLAMVAAGFTGGEADQLRRAMGKWKRNGELVHFREKLVTGMTARGYDEGFAQQLFEQICGFGEYGFPESHSASFAVLAYVSSWLKHYFPQAFYTALLNSLPMGFYSPSQLIQDAQRHQIQVLPVCVNHSRWHHQLVYQQGQFCLRLGFCLVKGFSEQQSELLEQKRGKEGFTRLAQIKALGLKRNELQALASANCFQALSGDRFNTRWQLMDKEDELPLFSQQAMSQETIDIAPNTHDNLIEDYASLGLSLDHHPIGLLKSAGLLTDTTSAQDLASIRHQSVVKVAGVVTGRQSPGTASGVTFMTLEDETGNMNVVVWVATARAQKQSFLSAKVLKVTGVLEREKQVVHVIAGRLEDITEQLGEIQSSSRDFH